METKLDILLRLAREQVEAAEKIAQGEDVSVTVSDESLTMARLVLDFFTDKTYTRFEIRHTDEEV